MSLDFAERLAEFICTVKGVDIETQKARLKSISELRREKNSQEISLNQILFSEIS